MNAQISHGAEMAAIFVHKPGISSIDAPIIRAGMGKACPESDHIPNRAAAQQLPGLLVCRCQPLILADHQLFPCLLRSLYHGFAILERNRHRLLT